MCTLLAHFCASGVAYIHKVDMSQNKPKKVKLLPFHLIKQVEALHSDLGVIQV